MKKILLFTLIFLFLAISTQAGFLGIKASTESICFPLLKAVDDTGAYVNQPDSAHVMTYADNGTALLYSAQTTTWPFSAISIDTSKIYGDTTLWFVDDIADIDGAGGNYEISIQVILWTDGQPTQTFATVQIVSDSLEAFHDSTLSAIAGIDEIQDTVTANRDSILTLLDSLYAVLDSMQSQSDWVAKEETVNNIALTGTNISTIASSRDLTDGTENTTFDSTFAHNGEYYKVAEGGTGTNLNINYYLEFDIGEDTKPVRIVYHGRLDEGSPPSGNDTIEIFVYDWVGTSWVHISPPQGDIIGVNGSTAANDMTYEAQLIDPNYVGTGGNEGLVRISFSNYDPDISATSNLEENTELYLDYVFLEFQSVLTAGAIADAVGDTLEAGTRSPSYVSMILNNPSGIGFAITGSTIGFDVNGGSGVGFDVTSTGSHATRFFSAGGNGHGLGLFGNGTGEGLNATGGTGGYGALFLGQNDLAGAGFQGGVTGDGAIFGGGATSGSGVRMVSPLSGYGLYLEASGAFDGFYSISSGTGNGFKVVGGADGHGAYFLGSGTGNGIQAQSGNGATGHGMALYGVSGTGNGLLASGNALDYAGEIVVNDTARNGESIIDTDTLSTTEKAALVDLNWDELQSGHTTAGTFGKYLDSEVSTAGGGASDTANIITAILRLVPGDTITASIYAKLMVFADSVNQAVTDANKGNFKSTGFTVPSDLDSLEIAIADANKGNFKADVSALALEASLFDPAIDSVLVDGSTLKLSNMWGELLAILGWGEFNGDKEVWARYKSNNDADTLFIGYRTSASTKDTTGYQVDYHVGGSPGDNPDSTQGYEWIYP